MDAAMACEHSTGGTQHRMAGAQHTAQYGEHPWARERTQAPVQSPGGRTWHSMTWSVCTCLLVRLAAPQDSGRLCLVVDETVILLHPPLPLVDVSIVMERESVNKMKVSSVAGCAARSRPGWPWRTRPSRLRNRLDWQCMSAKTGPCFNRAVGQPGHVQDVGFVQCGALALVRRPPDGRRAGQPSKPTTEEMS